MKTGSRVASPGDESDNERAMVRRVSSSPMLNGEAQRLPPKSHRGEGLIVMSELELWVEPKIYLSWAVLPSLWNAGYSLLVFHSTGGFCPEKFPSDLNKHGRLIIEASENGTREEHPVEGQHFYTFVLHKKGFFREKMSVLRLSETVPTARIAIGRIKDKVELEELLQRHELSGLDHESRLNEARLRLLNAQRLLAGQQALPTESSSPRGSGSGPKTLLEHELSNIDQTLAALVAKQRKSESLAANPEYVNLSPEDKATIQKAIDERLDVAELSARREQRGE